MSRIIIIDDDIHTLEALSGILDGRIDAEIETCSSALGGLKKISDSEYDVIVCDIKMPGMDGLALLTKIRLLRPATPVLMTTAYDETDMAVRALRAGANDFLRKPIDIEYLVVAITRGLRVRQTNRELEEKRRSLEARAAELAQIVEDRTAALRASHERLEIALEAGRMGTWEWHIQEQKIEWSASLETMHGLTPGSFGGTIEDFQREMHPDDRTRVSEIIADAVERCHDLIVQYRFLPADGQIRWAESKGKMFVDEQGKPKVMRGICTDVTQRKAIEDERNNLLKREQAARRQAESANRTKDEFLATLSHELRSPLTPMLGWARMLLSGNVDRDTQVRGLTVIERNVKAQAKLIEDLLDISRIVTGKMLLDMQSCDLVRILEAAVDIIRPSAGAKRITIHTDIKMKSLPMCADSTRLQQVVWNLLTNAVKFTPKDGEIRIELESVNSQARISVSDTGAGIKSEFLPLLFERFSQADSSATRIHGGLGIGLALVRNLVELHGGAVQAHSKGEGAGSTFVVTLPVKAVLRTSEHIENFGKNESAESGDASPLNGVNILVVDDDPDARELLAIVLGHAGAVVAAAGSVKEAFAQFQKIKPEIIISDLGMPVEDGFALIAKIRSYETEIDKRVPAIALTAYAGDADRIRCLSAGFQMHMAKPVDPFELIRGVSSLLLAARDRVSGLAARDRVSEERPAKQV